MRSVDNVHLLYETWYVIIYVRNLTEEKCSNFVLALEYWKHAMRCSYILPVKKLPTLQADDEAASFTQ